MKKTLYYLLIGILAGGIILLASRSSSPTATEAKEMIAAVHDADEAFNENDIKKYASYFTDDFIHDNVSRTPNNKEAFLEHVAGFFKKFPRIRNYQEALLPCGNFLVFDECTFIIPIPKRDISIKIFHMDIVEMEGNKLKVKTTFGDGASVQVALGLIEPPLPLPPPAPSFPVPDSEPTGLIPSKAQEKFQARWNDHDLSSLAKMVHADAQILVSPLLDPVGRNAYIGWQELLFMAFPDISMTTVRSYDSDGWAVSEVLMRGTNKGPYIGHPATGKSIELRAGYLTRYDEEGLITNLKLYIDSMNIMGQLGFEPVKLTAQ